jgi:hypothetical protein
MSNKAKEIIVPKQKHIFAIVSGILGFISLVFIKAGLFVFTAEGGSNLMAYLAIAFIAGYNVQNFLAKLEEVSKATLGIGKKGVSEQEAR